MNETSAVPASVKDTREENIEAQTQLLRNQGAVELANIDIAKAQAKIQQLVPFLNMMGEIRTALNYPMISDNQGFSDKIALEKMWDTTDVQRLRARYFKVMDKYFEVADIKLPE
jgi:hypothetical protein